MQEGVETLDSQALSQRLESDEDLVRVITVHKSKGLEYPIVLLPFISAFTPRVSRAARRSALLLRSRGLLLLMSLRLHAAHRPG